MILVIEEIHSGEKMKNEYSGESDNGRGSDWPNDN
jgi:hypothetical protein